MRAFILTVIGCGGLLLGFAATPSGCGDVDAAFDCQAVCSRYASCYDADYNVSQCRDVCRAKAKNDAQQRAKADQCEACIDDKSCASATFSCATECVGIVP